MGDGEVTDRPRGWFAPLPTTKSLPTQKVGFDLHLGRGRDRLSMPPRLYEKIPVGMMVLDFDFWTRKPIRHGPGGYVRRTV